MKSVSITFTLNGRVLDREIPSNQILADFIREKENLLGTKVSCDQSVCGACTVLVDGEPWSACAAFTFEVDKRDVLTLEGLADGNILSAVQEAFLTHSAFQCGYCTPGMIMLATSLLKQDPNPDEKKIRSWMGANICRCTGYQMIIEAVQTLAGKNI
ncbi:MAG: (2Fe-2S)-binding protein [Pseudomonadota bacterium]|nr:(2Fe-2S)-binding protein [Pseudomonadota bacterium]